MRGTGLAALALLLAGCTAMPGQQGATLREATAAQVGNCRYITDLTMTPGVYGPVVTEQALALARARVKDAARAAGADTIVFARPMGSAVYQIEAKAYLCGA